MLEQDTIQILVLAFIAGIVLFRLYTTLGKRTGEERHEPAPAQGELPRTPVQTPAAPSASVSVAGIAAVERADPNFEPGYFLQGASLAAAQRRHSRTDSGVGQISAARRSELAGSRRAVAGTRSARGRRHRANRGG